MAEGRFLRLERVNYVDAKGQTRTWESVQRQKAQQAVFIVARLIPSNRVVLIRQYRVPVEAFCLECPAGLIDEGENALDAAVRELREETGYLGKPVWNGGATSSSAGMTGELVTIVLMEVDESLPENQHPAQHLDDGEDIEVHAVPLETLSAYIMERQTAGDVVDSRLSAWNAGCEWR